jgi:2-polyprenyl-3-methyl-5-hydroxy-6-metoxy-1,4-benzoquinol methylase
VQTHAEEVRRGDRFRFGANWAAFLRVLDDERIAEAERSLMADLGVDRFDGLSFLDVGSGSGLFSLAARRLGARVHSFDYDPDSVACTQELRSRYFPDDDLWTVELGSILDRAYIATLAQHDIVYSWGVLHHTGAMWEALENVAGLVRAGGTLTIAIYNDQGMISGAWRSVKRMYCNSIFARVLIIGIFIPYFVLRGIAADLLRGQNPLTRFRRYRTDRGMSVLHDWLDWLGGYPFEVAKPEAVFEFFRDRGFEMRAMTTRGGGLGCNIFTFLRRA